MNTLLITPPSLPFRQGSLRDKKRILENGKLTAYEKLLKEITNIALEKGIEFGSTQVVDSVHTVADVNIEKDERGQKDGQPPRDGNARWGGAQGSQEEPPIGDLSWHVVGQGLTQGGVCL